jgi:hypothetical protein
MEPTSQLIRFSIPGSIFVLAAIGTFALAKVVWEQPLGSAESLATLTASITAIAASIPLGFLIYQAYYWGYSPFVIGDIVTRDRGREALSALPEEIQNQLRTLFDARLDMRRHHHTVDVPVLRKLRLLRLDDERLKTRYKEDIPLSREDEYKFEEDDRNIRRIYSDNWYENWDVFRAILDLVASHGDRPEIKRNFTTLYDIYHALGASRLAVVMGAMAGVFYLGGVHRADISAHVGASIVALVVIAGATALVAYVLHRTRIATWKSAVSRIRLDLRACFSTNADLVAALPAADGFTPRKELRRAHNARGL